MRKEMERVLFAGRSLLEEEVSILLQKNDILHTSEEWKRYIPSWIEKGMKKIPAVDVRSWIFRWRCHRCQAGYQMIKIQKCANCQGKCGVCQNCFYLGQARSCKSLYLFPNQRSPLPSTVPNSFPIQHTPGQEKAISQLEQRFQEGEREVLLYAVTGAGKTEVLLPFLYQTLEKGERVLWVIPRKDVIPEITARLREYFPTIRFAAWYGESEETWLDADVIVATAHQSCRFWKQFHLVVVDEVDAFPLFGNYALEQAIHYAVSDSGKLLYLTATPSNKMLKQVYKKKLPFVLLPQRYHGKPLPVPKIMLQRNLWYRLEKFLPIPDIENFISRALSKEGQALCFVPTMDKLFLVWNWLQMRFPALAKWITCVNSRDPQREEKIQSFRSNEIKLLLTTSILERGITVPKASVLVVGADHRLYDKTSLIQMAGRVGRKSEFQEGIVWFIARERTEALEEAVREIRWLNYQNKEGIYEKGSYYQK